MSTQPIEIIPAAQAPRDSAKTVSSAAQPNIVKPRPKEIGGRDGLEPTRYGDWEKNGRCVDF